MENVPDLLLDHEGLAAGLLAVSIAAVSWAADRRRARRRDPDKVGWVPWTGLFFWSTLAAVLLLGAAAKAWLAGN